MRIKMLASTAVQTPVAGPDGKVPQREVEFRDAKYRVPATVNSYLFAGEVHEVPDDVAKAQIALGHAVESDEPTSDPKEVAATTAAPSVVQPASPVTVTPAETPPATETGKAS